MERTGLTYKLTDTYWGRVYYKSPKGVIYALADEGTRGANNWVLYACSRDGEPSHPCSIEQFNIPLSKGTAALDEKTNAFIKTLN